MILWAFFYLSTIAVILGESPPANGYDESEYESESSGKRIDRNSNPQSHNSRFLDSGAEENPTRLSPGREIVDPEVADQLEGNGWLDVIPGTPEKDYPNYERIPETSFTCDDKTPGGYYADIEARCQVFHVCDTEGQKSSFLCPSGSIFNQKYFVCDWWYDFECDDATDLYSLNEKINRGGTGSGPGGPGRIEQNVDYSSDEENFPVVELQNQGNFVSADGFDLSLAGTGEGGPGYSRNGNSKGYQSNVDDEDQAVKLNGENREQGTRRKSFNGRRTASELSKLNNSQKPVKNRVPVRERSNPHGDSSEGSSSFGSVKDREEVVSGGGGEHFRRQNSPPGNTGVNYHPGYEGPNSNGPLKTNNFRNGNGRDDRPEELNRSQENIRNPIEHQESNNYPQRSREEYKNAFQNRNRNEKRDNFGQRSGQSRSEYSSGFGNDELSNIHGLKEEQRITDGVEGVSKKQEFSPDRSSGPSSGPNNNENRSSFVPRPANVRGAHRASGALQGGLGNGYPRPGRARELSGSDAIASGITPSGETLYDEGDQRSFNSQHRTSSSTRNSRGEKNSEKFDNWDENYPPGSDTSNTRSSKNGKYPGQNFSSRIEKSFDSNNRDGQVTHPGHESSRINHGSDYLVGIVPGTDYRGNGTSGSNQPGRYLPIL